MKVTFWGVTVLPPDGTAARVMVDTHIQDRIDGCGGRYYPTGTRLDFDFNMEGDVPLELAGFSDLLSVVQRSVDDESDGFEVVGDGDQLFLMWVEEDRKIHIELLMARHWPAVHINTMGSTRGPWKVPE